MCLRKIAPVIVEVEKDHTVCLLAFLKIAFVAHYKFLTGFRQFCRIFAFYVTVLTVALHTVQLLFV